MIELVQFRPDELERTGLAPGIFALLRNAFPEDGPRDGDYYRAVGMPEVAMVLREGPTILGHLGLYARKVTIGSSDFEIGLLGGITVAPEHRRAGHCRDLVQHAHQHLAARHIPFSILFAYEPKIYEGSS